MQSRRKRHVIRSTAEELRHTTRFRLLRLPVVSHVRSNSICSHRLRIDWSACIGYESVERKKERKKERTPGCDIGSSVDSSGSGPIAHRSSRRARNYKWNKCVGALSSWPPVSFSVLSRNVFGGELSRENVKFPPQIF